MLAREDGTLTANVGGMDALVRVAWGPIMRKYAGKEEPDEDLVHAHGGDGPHRGQSEGPAQEDVPAHGHQR